MSFLDKIQSASGVVSYGQYAEAAKLLSKKTETKWYVKWNEENSCIEIYVKRGMSALLELDGKVTKFFSEHKLRMESVIHAGPENQDKKLLFSRKINDSVLVAALAKISMEKGEGCQEELASMLRRLVAATCYAWTPEGINVSTHVCTGDALEVMDRLIRIVGVPRGSLTVTGDPGLFWKISINQSSLR